MDRLKIHEQSPEAAVNREPPKRNRNTLRAVVILVTSSLLSGLIFFLCFLYYQSPHATTTPHEPITKKEVVIPYPQSKQVVAREFGGRPSSWHKVGASGWRYDGNEPIAFPVGKNVRLWTFQPGLHWPVSDAQQKG